MATTIVETDPISALFYGGPGAGKTRMLASSMFDFKTGKVIRNGRMLMFGRERNISVARRLPPEMIKRFVSPVDQPDKFVDVTRHMETAIKALKQHETQVTSDDVGTHMKQWRSRTGEKVGFQYAEGFRRFHLG